MSTRRTTPRAASSPGTPRTLAEDLRARGDEALHALLRTRPDLLVPVPGDVTQLATRAGTRASVLRALEQLDRFTLQVAEALAVLPDGADEAAVRGLLAGDAPGPEAGQPAAAAAGDPRLAWSAPAPGGSTAASAPPAVRAGDVRDAFEALRVRALLWGPRTALHLVRTARDLLGPAPVTEPARAGRLSTAGLGPSISECAALLTPSRLQELLADNGLPPGPDGVSAAAALGALFADRERLGALLDGAPEPALGALHELVWGPPTGAVEDAMRPVRAADARTGIEWLLARGLLVPYSSTAVLLPREVAVRLRGGRLHRETAPRPPAPEVVERTPETVARAAAGQAFTALRTVEELLESWQAGGPPVLRSGGLGVRELRRVATVLDVPDEQAAFWLELAFAAGLMAPDGEVDEAWLPTPGYDAWLELPPEQRWVRLAATWLSGTRVAGLTGRKDAKGRAVNALGPELNRALAPEVRGGVLEALAGLPEGAAPSADGLVALIGWRRPLRGVEQSPEGGGAPLRDELVRWSIEEAELLGLTGRGALAPHARALLGADGAGAAAAALRPLLPEPLQHVLLQADLTAVAPGPLVPELARRLDLAADVESKGGATVYRFTPESVRRALDAGMTAADLQSFLAAHSTTPVPQPLAYLVDDVARRHGRLRVGTAGAYVRCDDDALLTELLGDRRTASLRLRRLAPTVLAAQAGPDQLIARLRELGHAPAAESEAGEVVVARRDARRTGPRRPPEPVHEGPEQPDEHLLAAAVRAVRAGEEAAAAAAAPTERLPVTPREGGSGTPRSSSADLLATVQSAVLAGHQLVIGYVSPEGHATRRVIEPARVEGGYVTAYDHLTDEVRTFSLHRMTGASELADGG